MKLEPLDKKAIHEPTVVSNVLKEFIDVMSPKLSKTLPPCRSVDHHIELELRVKSPVRPPYRMPPPELVELKKQLEYLNKFMVVYLDNIVVYSQMLEEHVEHLRTIFKVLRENTLFMKREKCYFTQMDILFLGYRISDGSIRMDKSKVQAVAEWQTPKKVPELRSYLGFVNYYRCFIVGYPKHATLLTELLKKEQPWRWSDKCEAAFQDLKATTVLVEPVLKLLDYGEPFEVYIDTSYFAIGGVLI
ncbi:uncharacterized mitochondrial protein AtMg00860-like [Musa acuminata AAA Group]|uniref:uncharacterized mitochondrial protein AtMg00860-like n=1 Tax=Musa acuminata AAA Group TaxID=214697 RepID=UPI0031CDDB1D